MTDEQAKNLCDKVEKELQAIPEWYLNRSKQLKVLNINFLFFSYLFNPN